MTYVIDSSVAFKWAVAELHQDKALLLRADFSNALCDLIAPDFFHAEVAHALTRAERQGRITAGEALGLWTDVMSTAPQFHPSLPMIPRAIDLSSQLRIGVYDCVYIAQAEQAKCDFITADDKLINNVQKQFPFVRHLSTLP
jgi:predicted nucleic acid-binding protein